MRQREGGTASYNKKTFNKAENIELNKFSLLISDFKELNGLSKLKAKDRVYFIIPQPFLIA